MRLANYLEIIFYLSVFSGKWQKETSVVTFI